MHEFSSISDLPNVPAVYAMYGGRNRSRYVAYVGIAGDLRSRINQHLVLRDSSIATGVSAVHLNPDYVSEIRYWTHENFGDTAFREAAEIIAFEILNPALRSRGAITARARQLCENPDFCGEMKLLFSGEPTGFVIIPTLQTALEKINQLEKRIIEIEKLLKLQTQ